MNFIIEIFFLIALVLSIYNFMESCCRTKELEEKYKKDLEKLIESCDRIGEKIKKMVPENKDPK